MPTCFTLSSSTGRQIRCWERAQALVEYIGLINQGVNAFYWGYTIRETDLGYWILRVSAWFPGRCSTYSSFFLNMKVYLASRIYP